MKKICLIQILICLFHLQFAQAGLKESALKVLPAKKEITVTGHPDYAPIIWKSKKKNELHGLAVELVQMAFAELGVKVKTFNSETWGRALEEVKEGRVDMLLPPYLNKERLIVYDYYKKPILMDETAVFIKSDKKMKFNQFSDLKKYNGAAIIDDSFGSEFDLFSKTNLKIERLTTTQKCLEFLMSDRADYVIAGLNSGTAVMAKMGLTDKIKILPKRIVLTGLYAPFSKKSEWSKPEIQEFINQKIASYVQSGVAKKLEKKYWELFKTESSE